MYVCMYVCMYIYIYSERDTCIIIVIIIITKNFKAAGVDAGRRAATYNMCMYTITYAYGVCVCMCIIIHVCVCIQNRYTIQSRAGRRAATYNMCMCTPGLHNKIPAHKIFARVWVAQEPIFS